MFGTVLVLLCVLFMASSVDIAWASTAAFLQAQTVDETTVEHDEITSLATLGDEGREFRSVRQTSSKHRTYTVPVYSALC